MQCDRLDCAGIMVEVNLIRYALTSPTYLCHAIIEK